MKKQDIENLEKIISINRTSRDYCEDISAARDLAKRIQDYWHKRGQSWVKIWLEPIDLPSGRKRWDIRGNIVFGPK